MMNQAQVREVDCWKVHKLSIVLFCVLLCFTILSVYQLMWCWHQEWLVN